MSRDSHTSTRFATLARIVKVHGKDGEVWVCAQSSEQAAASSAILDVLGHAKSSLWLTPPPAEQRFVQLSSQRGGRKDSDRLLLGFEGITHRAAARDLLGRDLVVERCDVPADLWQQFTNLQQTAQQLQENDDCGLAVYSDRYGHLGSVVEVIKTGANDVWVVRGDRYGQVLLPVIDDCVLAIDRDAQTAHVQVMKGLIDQDPINQATEEEGVCD
ncbi:MAG: hypothetical protein FWF11_03255 [Coriobacteriia bacterium]|nr:hypothetical protein [Coriobacteriia bacterium]